LHVNNFKLEDDTHFDVTANMIRISNTFKNEMIYKNNNNTNTHVELEY